MDKLENVVRKLKREYDSLNKKKVKCMKSFELIETKTTIIQPIKQPTINTEIVKVITQPTINTEIVKVITQPTNIGIVNIECGKFTLYI